ncbi:hypothetical protein CYLTODRAFT_451495 [Cylindrobasidium torrendii FP15055 ss-10]|uniref:Uncharacterized protein n=1 Tax=Cylindrobasidium torrendii FP15055 ss-10 TaxID=1314674 RepID=A0A0D7BMB5_9AGAR|nr:hypothetical protein CYLTODRAFT_451495 [Cylindrobasidium torrendii FP15055 ss-10]
MLCEPRPVEETFSIPLPTPLSTLMAEPPPWCQDIQLDLMYRLRFIEQLQTVSPPQACDNESDDCILDILNWIALCFMPDETRSGVSVAFASQANRITLHVSKDRRVGDENVKDFLTTVRAILAGDITDPGVTAPVLFRMVVDRCPGSIMRKITSVADTDEGAGQTIYRFNSIFATWLAYRPEGETSLGFISMATKYGGDAKKANEYLLESFSTLATQTPDQMDGMGAKERFTYISSVMTASSLLLASTFFADITHSHSFRLALKLQDRQFMHQIWRRLSDVSAYKHGALQFAYVALPYIRSIVGDLSAGQDVHVELVPGLDEGTYRWGRTPAEQIQHMLPKEDGATPSCSRPPEDSELDSDSEGSRTAPSTATFGMGNTACDELLNSELALEAWVAGADAKVSVHPELQLVHHMLEHGVNAAYKAIGTSKPMCWTCSVYLEHLSLAMGEERDDEQWWHAKGTERVTHRWMMPKDAPDVVVHGVLEDVQSKMEKLVDDVAFDCYF